MKTHACAFPVPPGEPGANAVVLNGSPHPRGNGMTVAAVITSALGGEARVVHLYEKTIAPCRACAPCRGDDCRHAADDMPDVLRALAEADCIVLASPLHFTSLSAPLVACISRLQLFWRRPSPVLVPEKLRLGCLVLTGGGEYPEMFRPARSVARAAFNTLGVEYAGMVGVPGTDGAPAASNPAALTEAEELGRVMLRKILAAKT